MPNTPYWLNFRIEDDDKAPPVKPNHKQRYEAMVEIVEEYALTWWRQSLALYIFDTNIDIDKVAPLFKKIINPATDYIILGEVGKEAVRVMGRYNDPDLFKILPFAQEVK